MASAYCVKDCSNVLLAKYGEQIKPNFNAAISNAPVLLRWINSNSLKLICLCSEIRSKLCPKHIPCTPEPCAKI